MPRETEVIRVTFRAKHLFASMSLPAESVPATRTVKVHNPNGAITGWWPLSSSWTTGSSQRVTWICSHLCKHWGMGPLCYHILTYPTLINITPCGIIYPHVSLSKWNILDWYLAEKLQWPKSSLLKNISSSCSEVVSVSGWHEILWKLFWAWEGFGDLIQKRSFWRSNEIMYAKGFCLLHRAIQTGIGLDKEPI